MSSKGSVSGSTEDLVLPTGLRDLAGGIKERVLLDYSSYMTSLVGSESSSPTRSPCHSDHGSPTVLKRVSSQKKRICDLILCKPQEPGIIIVKC